LRNQLLDQHSITLDAPDPKAPDLMIGNAEMGGLVAPDGLGVDRAFRADFFKTTISRLPILPVRLQAETADGNTPGVASYRQTMRLADGIVRTHVEYAGAMGGYDAEVFFDNDPARKNLLVIRVTPFGAAGKLNWFAKLPVEFEKRPNYWDGWQNDKPFPVSAEDLYDAAQPATHRVSGTVKPHRLDPKPLAPKTNYCDDDGYALGSSYPNPFVPFPGEPSTPHWEASCTRALTKVAGRGRYALAPGDDGITLVFAAASLNWTAFTPEENAALANPATFDALRAGHIAAWKKDWEKTPVIITPEERYNQLYYRSLFWLLSTAGSKKFLPGEAQFGCDCWGMSPFTVGHAGWGIHALYRLGHSERGRRMIGNFADLDTLRDNGAVFLRKKGTGAMCVPHMFGSTVKYFFDYAEQQHLIAFAESFLQLPVIFETPGSQDEYFRNVLYPASKGFALFWMNLDTTKETSADGRQSGLVYRPLRSLSENLIERNPLDAVLAAKWCLNTAADYADRLRVDAAEAKAWRQRANDILLSTRNTDNGPIFAEWFGDTVRKAGAYQGIRSPVYLGWPTDQTQVFDRDICLRTLDDAFVRNDKGIGGIPFVTTWLALAELRFGRGDRAYEWMENNFYSRDSRVGCIYEFKPPKSRARNPYFGTCQDAYLVALCEMLLQTDGPTYKLFPAVPSQWKHIVMLHMPAGNGRTCSAIYDNGQITAQKITNGSKAK
jgi:hypothetical protein